MIIIIIVVIIIVSLHNLPIVNHPTRSKLTQIAKPAGMMQSVFFASCFQARFVRIASIIAINNRKKCSERYTNYVRVFVYHRYTSYVRVFVYHRRAQSFTTTK